jgi:hypothetical protein
MGLFGSKEYDAVGDFPDDRTQRHVGDKRLRPDVRELEEHVLKDSGKRFSRNSSMNRLRRREVRRLVNEGSFLEGDVSQLPGGTADPQASCAAAMNASPEKFDRWSGVATRSNGTWGRHTWLVDREDGRIVEATSEGRSRYLGVKA